MLIDYSHTLDWPVSEHLSKYSTHENVSHVVRKMVILLEISCIKMNMLYTFVFFYIIHKYPGTVILFFFKLFFVVFKIIPYIKQTYSIQFITYINLPFNFCQHLHILFCSMDKVFLQNKKAVGWQSRKSSYSQTQTIPQTILLSKIRNWHLQQHWCLLKLRQLHSTQMLVVFLFFFFFTLFSRSPTNTMSAPQFVHMIFVMGFDMQHIYFCKSKGNISLRQTPELLLWQIPQTADKNGVLQLYIVFQQWKLNQTTR